MQSSESAVMLRLCSRWSESVTQRSHVSRTQSRFVRHSLAHRSHPYMQVEQSCLPQWERVEKEVNLQGLESQMSTSQVLNVNNLTPHTCGPSIFVALPVSKTERGRVQEGQCQLNDITCQNRTLLRELSGVVGLCTCDRARR